MYIKDEYEDTYEPKTVQFDTASHNRDLKKLLEDFKDGKIDFDSLTDEEKEYIKKHDATYGKFFI